MRFSTHIVAAFAITLATFAAAAPVAHGTHDVRSYAKETKDKRDPADFDFLAVRDKAATNAGRPTKPVNARDPSELDARDKAATNAGRPTKPVNARDPSELDARDKAATNAWPVKQKINSRNPDKAATNAWPVKDTPVFEAQDASFAKRDKSATNAKPIKSTPIFELTETSAEKEKRDQAATNAVKPVKEPIGTIFTPISTAPTFNPVIAPAPAEIASSIAISKGIAGRGEAATNACRPNLIARTAEERAVPVCPSKRGEAATNACRPYIIARTVEERAVPVCPSKRGEAATNACRPRTVFARLLGDRAVPICPKKRSEAALNAGTPIQENAKREIIEARGEAALNAGTPVPVVEARDKSATNACPVGVYARFLHKLAIIPTPTC